LKVDISFLLSFSSAFPLWNGAETKSSARLASFVSSGHFVNLEGLLACSLRPESDEIPELTESGAHVGRHQVARGMTGFSSEKGPSLSLYELLFSLRDAAVRASA
jgi:hypothetical protein